MTPNKLLCTIAILCLAISGCTSYKQIDITKDQLFFTKNPEKASLKNCEVYIHDENNSIKLTDPILQGETIKGEMKTILTSDEIVNIKNPQNRKEKEIHKRDVHIYLKNNLVRYSASNDLSQITSTSNITISKDDIKNIRAYASDKKNTLGFILLFVVLGFMATFMFLALLVFSFNQSSNAYNNSSGGGSASE